MEHVKLKSKRKPAARRGLATVEMALLLPILLVLTFAAIEYGWMFFKQQQITNAAREAARLGATPNGTNGTVTARVTQLMTDAGIDSGQYTLTINPGVGGLTPTTLFTVTISVNYPSISLTKMADSSKAIYIPAPQTLSASVAMNKEGP
jgi:Flp pilus assembly protein TadG